MFKKAFIAAIGWSLGIASYSFIRDIVCNIFVNKTKDKWISVAKNNDSIIHDSAVKICKTKHWELEEENETRNKIGF